MVKEYGELMAFLLRHREKFEGDERFRGFVVESVRRFAQDLRDLNVEISIKPEALSAKKPTRDWNYLKIGCE